MRKITGALILLLAVILSSCNQPEPAEEAAAPEVLDMLRGNVESYYFSTTMTAPFDTVEWRVREALKAEGFGVITQINVQETIKKKLDKDFHKYLILGACSPNHAYQALLAEDKIGTMLPCNVIIQEKEEGTFEIAAVNPVASMMAIDNEELTGIALEVTDKLKRVIASLENM